MGIWGRLLKEPVQTASFGMVLRIIPKLPISELFSESFTESFSEEVLEQLAIGTCYKMQNLRRVFGMGQLNCSLRATPNL